MPVINLIWRRALDFIPACLLLAIMMSQIYSMLWQFAAAGIRPDALAVLALIIDAVALYLLLRRRENPADVPAK